MIAPSPDWFSGIASLSMKDSKGNWFRTVVIDLPPYDAGSDSGTTYKSPDRDQNGKIFQLTKKTVPKSSGVFLNPGGGTVLPVARLQCRLRNTKSRALRCSRRITQGCSASGQCCPGLKCLSAAKGRRCLPCLRRTEKCSNSGQCCGKSRCSSKTKLCV